VAATAAAAAGAIGIWKSHQQTPILCLSLTPWSFGSVAPRTPTSPLDFPGKNRSIHRCLAAAKASTITMITSGSAGGF